MYHDNDLADRQDGRVALAHDAELGPDQADGPSGVDAPFGLAGGECSYSSTPSSSLEPSGSTSETTEDRTIEYGSVEFEAAYDAEYYELRRAVESYILNRAGMDDSASGEDRDKALEAGDFYEINEFDGDLRAGWAKDPDSGMPTFLSFTSGGGWWCAAMVDGRMDVVSEGAARPVPRRTRASRAAARRERRAAAGTEEEEGLVRTARARSRGRGGVGWRETLVLAEELEGCA